MWDLTEFGVTGNHLEKLYGAMHITTNKSLANPGWVRLGALCMTSRGLTEEDMENICEYLLRGAEICKRITGEVGAEME